jgi:hypothetical protein
MTVRNLEIVCKLCCGLSPAAVLAAHCGLLYLLKQGCPIARHTLPPADELIVDSLRNLHRHAARIVEDRAKHGFWLLLFCSLRP